MDDRVRKGVEDFLEQAVTEQESGIFLKHALDVDIPREDGVWLKSMFRLAVTFLVLIYGSKKEANRWLPWLLFSLGMAYERYYKKEDVD